MRDALFSAASLPVSSEIMTREEGSRVSEIMYERYCIDIENALTSLQERLEIRVAGNLTDPHIYAEAIMTSVLNPTLGLDLKSANISSPNAPAIDLVDVLDKTIVQVSTDSSREKIQSSLNKGKLAKYTGYHLMFMFLVPRHPRYQNKPFDNPYNVSFDVTKDVLDLNELMVRVRALPIPRLEAVHDILMREIHFDRANPSKLMRGLSDIVRALMTANPEERKNQQPIAFRIEEKIQKNGLARSKRDIQELSALTYPLESIYDEYEREGIGRSRSVFRHLQMVRKEEDLSPDETYDAIIHNVVEELCVDGRLSDYTYEDVEFYVAVVVVDAFMRCKIFDGPSVWESR